MILIVKKTLYLWQLFGNVAAHKHGLQVDPQVLHDHPVLDDLGGRWKLLHPLLDCFFKRRIVAVAHQRAQYHKRILHQGYNFGGNIAWYRQNKSNVNNKQQLPSIRIGAS